MRYAQGPGTHGEVLVRAGVGRVWELVSDIALPARLSPELQRTAWLDGASGPAVGARFEGHNSRAGMADWRTVCEVTELVEGRVFAWGVMDADGCYGDPVDALPGSLARWRFDLADGDGGGVRVRLSAVIGPGRSGLSAAIDAYPQREEEFVALRLSELRAGIEATLAGVKSLAEQGG
ncbi:SRPBCC family protein [Streptomyces sp. NRRL WC-3742]|uniref:SRPBCC family protein n=1 Tax=Streptomyces sp. NRRL WC-3742 TaxID=1463934 RepID=UPI0004C55BC2|nr:SRPBCC family protein [Streptomyces sp. NRRL WC-3742]